MNITVFANSFDLLFDVDRPAHAERLWSLGRFPKPVKAGNRLHFRWEGKIVARAICSRVSKPGEFDAVMHDGTRVLRGHKVHWKMGTFEDLRDKPNVVAQIEAAWLHRWRCRMCNYVHTKKSPGVPQRSCPKCGCQDRRYWHELKEAS